MRITIRDMYALWRAQNNTTPRERPGRPVGAPWRSWPLRARRAPRALRALRAPRALRMLRALRAPRALGCPERPGHPGRHRKIKSWMKRFGRLAPQPGTTWIVARGWRKPSCPVPTRMRRRQTDVSLRAEFSSGEGNRFLRHARISDRARMSNAPGRGRLEVRDDDKKASEI